MFLEYFGLIEQPFGVTPDPRFLHLGPKHREALASLVCGTESDRGFLALIAKPGMGKTTLLYQFLESQRGKSRSAFFFQSDCQPRELPRYILADLGVDASGKDLPAMRAMLQKILLEEKAAGRRFLLVIDEAQNLEEKFLESIRLLSNFETPWAKLMQIILAGQPQLAERLARPSMAQLRQRISSIIRLEPFTTEEVQRYISHRLWVGGYSSEPLFTVGAQILIAEASGGIPRNINTLCFNAMSLAYAMKARRIDAKIVREALADLEIEPLIPARVKAASNHSSLRSYGSLSLLAGADAPRKPRRQRNWIPAAASIAALALFAALSGSSWNRNLRTPALEFLPVGESIVHAAAPSPVVAAIHLESDSPAKSSAQPRVVTIIAPPSVTLRHLSLEYLGRYDGAALREIQVLNPGITNPDRIQTGHAIRLPLDSEHSPAANTNTMAANSPAAKEVRP
jgi:general secretion pathway protein A